MSSGKTADVYVLPHPSKPTSLRTTYVDGQTKRDSLLRMHATLEMSITMWQGLVPNACRIEKRSQDSDRFGDPRD